MAYASDYFLNWLATQVAGQALTVRIHTGNPGNNGTAARARDNSNTRTGVPKVIAAGNITADGARADNDDKEEFFTPNSTSAGQTITHLSYYFGANFIGWVEAATPRTTVDGEAFPLDAGGAALTFALASG